MKKEKTAKQIRDAIDKEKARALEKTVSHHLTRVTGSRNAMEYVVCNDGTEIAYSKSEEELLISMLVKESTDRSKVPSS